MENVTNVELPLRLSFTLTRLQQIMNPPERIFYALVTISTVVFFGIIIWFVPGSWPVGVGMGLGVILFVMWSMGGITLGLITSILFKEYVNTVEFGHHYLRYGFEEIEYEIMLPPFRISKGLFHVIILRYYTTGHSIVLPQSAISIEHVKELIEQSWQRSLSLAK